MPLGYSSPLYALSCAQRAPLVGGLCGWQEPLDAAQTTQLASVKAALYSGFRRAAAATLAHRAALVVVDPDQGAELFRHAAAHGFITGITIDGDGDIDPSPARALHIVDELPACFATTRLVVDAGGLGRRHERALARLRRLMPSLRARDRRLLVELRTPSRDPLRTLRAMLRLQELGIEPDVWMLDALPPDAARLCVAIARRDGRDRVGCMVLVESTDDEEAGRGLEAAARTPGFIGFGVEPALFAADVAAWRAGGFGWDGLVARVAERYRRFIDAFEPVARAAAHEPLHLQA